MRKKLVSILAIITCTITLLVGCASSDTPTVATDEGQSKVALVVAGGLGDRSFYDCSNVGIKMAEEKLGIKTKVLECKNDATLYQDQLNQASNIADIIVVAGYEFYDAIKQSAKQFPQKKYIYIDNVVEGIDNIICIDYQENEGAYLAGALAALESKTGMIGLVGGEDIDVIRNFKVGYEEGAKYINKDIKVETVYAGSFEDPAKGKESAIALYSKGCDIIFQVAGKTGEGVFQAAKDLDKFAIGVDTDQRYINPNVIMASMEKGLGTSIYNTIEKIQNSETLSNVCDYGVKQGGVFISYGSDDMPNLVKDENKAKIEDIKAKISDGQIKVSKAD